MEATQVSIPTPEANDSEEVQAALTAASNLWEQDPREALRWLRKAAESASDAGDDLRSVHLARAAADLRSSANIQASLPPSGAPSAPGPAQVPVGGAAAIPAVSRGDHNPAQTVPATPAAAAAAALQQASHAAQAAAAQSFNAAPVQAAADDAAAAAVRAQQAAQDATQQAAARAAAQQAAAQEAAQQQAAQQQAAQQQAAQQAAAQQAAQQQAAQLAAQQQAAQQAEAQLAATHDSEQAVERAAVEHAATQPDIGEPVPASSPPSAPRFVSHRSVRVALSPAPSGPGQFSVHPLAEGESPEPGWKEVLLVALDPAERIFPGKN